MDPHPTPFPGKRRLAGNPATMKERDQPKPATSLTRPKPKRTFGRNLSGNITIERPSLKPLTAKPWKPSGVSKNEQKPSKKVASALSCAGGVKSGSNKKAHHVTFVETQPTESVVAMEESIEVSHDDLLVCTPVLSIEASMQETPYHSAENCSKCRLDRLETSSYWISQVKLAESTGKHFASAAFFRLALECEAQPFLILQNELKHYRDRHGVVFMESLWDDLLRDYGLTTEQHDSNSCDVDSIDAVLVEQFDSKSTINIKEDGDLCVDFDIIEKPEESMEDLEAKNDEPEEILHVKRSEDGMLKLSSSMDSPLKIFQDVVSPSTNSVLRDGVRRSVKIFQKKSNFGDLISSDSAADTRKNKAISGIHNSSSKPVWKKKAGEIGSSEVLKSKNTAAEQYTSNYLDKNANLVEDKECGR